MATGTEEKEPESTEVKSAAADSTSKSVAKADPKEPPVMEGPDQGVLQVFVLGWRIAQLHRYATVPPRPAARPDSDRGLPGLRDLDDRAQRIRLGIAEVAATLHRLSDRLAEAGLALPDTRALLQAADAGQEITPQLQRLNLILVVQLNAAEYRLQTGFALGRELYDTTRTVDNQDDLKRVLKHHRLLGLRESLQALQSAFPPHAARAVSLSLGQWRQWAQEDAPADFVRVRDLLRRQGDLWHSLLSGERSGTDLLDAEDYLSAAEQMFRSARGVSGRFCRQFSAPIVFIVLLVAGSLGLAIGIGSGAVTLAALGAVATALGVSWSGLRATLGTIGERLSVPLWGASLDHAIAAAIDMSAEIEKRDSGV